MQTKEYDAIVIGGGHNGLVTAAYLAKEKKSVAVLEAKDNLGGCAYTQEVWPGYKVSPAAYVLSLMPKDVISDLKLKENGLEILRRDPSSYTPDPDGPGLVMGRDRGLTQTEISRYSEQDAFAYPRYEENLVRIVEKLEPIIDSIPPNVLSTNGRDFSLFDLLGQLPVLWKQYKNVRKLGNDFTDASRVLLGAATPILDEYFESDILKTTIATDAVIGSYTTPSQPGSAYVLFHHVMGDAGGERGVWGYVRGGMGGLSDSLESTCNQLGVDIFRGEKVKRIDVDTINGSAHVYGVSTEKNLFSSKVVASSVDPHLTFNKFIADKTIFPPSFVEAVDGIAYGGACSKINFALDRLPQFRGTLHRDFPYLTGTIHIPHTMDGIERAFLESKVLKGPSQNPIIEMSIPTTVDATLAPEGKHIAQCLVQYTPYEVEEGWDTVKEEFADRVVHIIEERAPGFTDSILHRQIITPLDLERDLGLTQGNIFQGDMIHHQMGPMRPVAGWSDHRTPIKGLYMCGAACHPGGGVTGIPGRNAARQILKDLRRE